MIQKSTIAKNIRQVHRTFLLNKKKTFPNIIISKVSTLDINYILKNLLSQGVANKV